MEIVLRNLQWDKCVLYLDDIIVYGKDFASTLQNLREVLSRFALANLKLKPSKCTLMSTSVEFLGHIVSQEGVSCDPAKISAVIDWPRPTNIKEIRSFCGFCQYYRKHIENFSEIAAPLHALTRKRVKFEWSAQHEQAFTTLKHKLTTAPVLAYPRREARFILDVDASLHSVGAVLSQEDENGTEKPVAYASKTLSRTQQNYCTTMRELLGVVVFLRHFHHYVYGREILLQTDHASLTWLTNLQESSGMLAHWLATLGEKGLCIKIVTACLEYPPVRKIVMSAL